MTTMDLIKELRDQADVTDKGTLYHMLHESADRLEALDERVCIMGNSMDSIEKRIVSWKRTAMLFSAIIVVQACVMALMCLIR